MSSPLHYTVTSIHTIKQQFGSLPPYLKTLWSSGKWNEENYHKMGLFLQTWQLAKHWVLLLIIRYHSLIITSEKTQILRINLPVVFLLSMSSWAFLTSLKGYTLWILTSTLPSLIHPKISCVYVSNSSLVAVSLESVQSDLTHYRRRKEGNIPIYPNSCGLKTFKFFADNLAIANGGTAPLALPNDTNDPFLAST